MVSAVATTSAFYNVPASADPAANAASFSQITAGAVSTIVPDGTCAAIVSVAGGGGSSPTSGGTGGIGGSGARIGAKLNVLPLQAVTGVTASGGVYNVANGGVASGGSGTAAGGIGGPIASGSTNRRWWRW